MKKRGFTLIELLAVIVILAILALIVSPIISGVIEKARKSEAERSMEGYVKTLNLTAMEYQVSNAGAVQTSPAALVASAEAENKGRVKDATIVLDPVSGYVSTITGAKIGNYTCSYDEKQVDNQVTCNK